MGWIRRRLEVFYIGKLHSLKFMVEYYASTLGILYVVFLWQFSLVIAKFAADVGVKFFKLSRLVFWFKFVFFFFYSNDKWIFSVSAECKMCTFMLMKRRRIVAWWGWFIAPFVCRKNCCLRCLCIDFAMVNCSTFRRAKISFVDWYF